MANDDFTQRRFQWLDQVASDPEVPAAGFVLAYWIGKHIDRGSGAAWPSHPLLAAEARLTVRSIRDLSAQLEARGHLTIIASRGRGVSCRYRPILQAEPDQPEPEPEIEAAIDAPAPEPKDGELFLDSVDTAPKSAPRAKEDWTADFDRFWTQYPRRGSECGGRPA